MANKKKSDLLQKDVSLIGRDFGEFRKNLIEFNWILIWLIFISVRFKYFQKTIDKMIKAVTKCSDNL